jgi:hypothetical protein
MMGLPKGPAAQHPWVQHPIEPAETGQPKTLADFAWWMRDRFVLKGPAEQKEGGIHIKEPNPEPEPYQMTRPVTRNEDDMG